MEDIISQGRVGADTLGGGHKAVRPKSDTLVKGSRKQVTQPSAAVHEKADSLGQKGVDSLANAPADTLLYYNRGEMWWLSDLLPEAPLPVDSLLREVEAPVVFGEHSVAVEGCMMQPARVPALTEQPLFQGFVLFLAFVFALIINKFLPDVKALLGSVFTYHNAGERLSPGSNNNNVIRLLDDSAWVGALMVGAAVVRFCGDYVPQEVGSLLNGATALVVMLAVLAALVVVHLFQYLTLRATGEVLLCQNFITQLWQVKRICFSLFVISVTPPLLLYMFAPDASARWLLAVMVLMSLTALFVYVRETIGLFLSKKISILHWFLYLCTVELFPISLLWLLVVKKL